MGKRNVIGFALLGTLAFLAGCGVGAKRQNDAKVHYVLGISYLQEPNATLALKEFLLAEAANPHDANIQAALGQAYQVKKAYPAAERHYLEALELQAGNPAFQNNLAALYLDMGRFDDAIRYFRLASANLLFNSPEVALTGMGYAYFQKGEYLPAVAAIKDALSHSPRYALAHLRLGEVYFALDKSELAIHEFQQATTLVPGNVLARYKLGLAYMKGRQQQLSAEAFRDVVRLAPDSEEARLSAEYLKLLN